MHQLELMQLTWLMHPQVMLGERVALRLTGQLLVLCNGMQVTLLVASALCARSRRGREKRQTQTHAAFRALLSRSDSRTHALSH